jgi:hypothetical protein
MQIPIASSPAARAWTSGAREITAPAPWITTVWISTSVAITPQRIPRA